MRIALESAQMLDERLAGFPPALLDDLHRASARWVERSLHRDAHLDEIEAG
ncbi:MAG: hypothetical protein KJZ86_16540 [Caldilineaceae bacterium]|nr:hypothetical protein [Caldilineaceae bacterium]HRJ43819.1 hypothetical protein [Caldilineaceae bacterium]